MDKQFKAVATEEVQAAVARLNRKSTSWMVKEEVNAERKKERLYYSVEDEQEVGVELIRLVQQNKIQTNWDNPQYFWI